MGDKFDSRLNAIIEYKLNELEAKAYKLSLVWRDLSFKMFPDYNHTKIRSGDPRKSMPFKLCYKLIRETQGIIPDHEYPLYVRAQLDVLKYMSQGKILPLIDPNCLVGDKAWKRWKLWKKKYDQKVTKPYDSESFSKAPGIAKALDGLEKTKEFIVKNMGPTPDIEKYKQAYDNKNLLRWINLSKISPYYLVVSPFIQRILTQDDYDKLNFDPKIYKDCIDDTVLEKFNKLFGYESTQ